MKGRDLEIFMGPTDAPAHMRVLSWAWSIVDHHMPAHTRARAGGLSGRAVPDSVGTLDRSH